MRFPLRTIVLCKVVFVQLSAVCMAFPDPRSTALRKPRLWRLLGADGFCLDVAIDHGFFNEQSFLTSIEDMTSVIKTIVDAQVQNSIEVSDRILIVR